MSEEPPSRLPDNELHDVFDRMIRYNHRLSKRFQIRLPDLRLLMNNDIDELFEQDKTEIRKHRENP